MKRLEKKLQQSHKGNKQLLEMNQKTKHLQVEKRNDNGRTQIKTER